MIIQSKIIAALTAIIIVGSYFLYLEIQSHGHTKAELKSAEATTELLESSINEAELARISVEEDINKITLETSKLNRELAKLSGREATVVAKPGLVEIKLNKAFEEQQRLLGCITGDTNLCQ